MAKDRMLSVIISANAEWEAVKRAYPAVRVKRSPYGQYFKTYLGEDPALFFHGGWGKVAQPDRHNTSSIISNRNI